MSNHKDSTYWKELIQSCRDSGLTDRQWCLQHDISCSSFYYNAKKLREQACELPVATGRTTAEVNHDVVRVTLFEEEPTTTAEPILAEAELPACYSAFYTIPKSTLFQQYNESPYLKKSDDSPSDSLISGTFNVIISSVP